MSDWDITVDPVRAVVLPDSNDPVGVPNCPICGARFGRCVHTGG